MYICSVLFLTKVHISLLALYFVSGPRGQKYQSLAVGG